MKKSYPITGLDCANCAQSLENALAKVKGVENITVSFMTGMLTLTAADAEFDSVLAEVVKKAAKVEAEAVIHLDGKKPEGKKKTAHSHEHDHECSCGCGHDHHHDDDDDDDCCCGHDHHDDDDDDDDHECHCGHEHHHHDDDEEDHHDHKHEHHHDDDDDDDHDHDHGHSHEHEEGGFPILWRLALAVVLFVMAFLLRGTGEMTFAVLMLLSYAVVGYDVLLRAVKNILRGQIFDENFLMAVASVGAVIMGEYEEAAAVMALYQLGEWFQDRAVDSSRRSISSLMDIRPDTANLLEEDGDIVTVSPEDVHKGDCIVIRPGEKVPLDGVVLEGVSSLNTVALTGESLPRDVKNGDAIASGCVNLTGTLTVQVTGEFSESTVSKILNLVETSGESKAQAEKFISRFARYYTPCVCAAALLLAVVPSLVTGDWQKWIYQALSFLVISCPCALVISVPLTFFSAIGGASRKGILVKGANYLEALAKADTMAFDKTGTLTHGVFSVSSIHPAAGVNSDEVLALAAQCECDSSHPIAVSLREKYGKEINRAAIADVKEIAGKGISAVVSGKAVSCGNTRLMADLGLKAMEVNEIGSQVHVAADGKYLGCITIADTVKDAAKTAMAQLKELGLQNLVMLSGDRTETAKAVAAEIGLTDVRAQLLPEDKVSALESLLGENHTVAYIGDGLNDAPVLRRADIGMAMGAMGADAAIEAADVVLMDDDIAKLPVAVRHARRSMGIVKQNIVFSLAVKGVIMVLGFLGFASMWLAVFADVGVAMLAILNAMRAMKVK